MPKQQEISVLYGKFDILKEVPATYAEIDALVGEADAGLGGWLADTSARNFLPRLYEAVAVKLTEMGHPHKQIGTRKAAKEGGADSPIYETDIVHVDRVHTDGDDALKATIGTLINDANASLPFWSKRAGGGGGAGRISTDALEGANSFFAKGPDTVEKVAAHIEGFVPGYTVLRDSSGSPTPESLARAIMAMNRKIEDDAKKASANALAGLGA